jgi:hypothetical protein
MDLLEGMMVRAISIYFILRWQSISLKTDLSGVSCVLRLQSRSFPLVEKNFVVVEK